MAIPIPNQTETAKQIRKVNELPRQSYHYTKTFDPIYIYNIGRWAGEDRNFWVRNAGTGHTFIIPLAAAKDFKHTEDYAEKLRELDPNLSEEEIKAIIRGVRAGEHSMPCLVQDPTIEFYPTRLGSPAKAETWEGKRIAQEVVNMVPGDDGVGAGKNPQNDLRFWGVFIAKGKVPTKQEMDEVRVWYFKRLDEKITEGNELFRDNRFKEILRVHRFAAEERGIKAPWNKELQEMTEPKRVPCPECRELIMEGARVCIHCKTRFDQKPEPQTVRK